MDLSMCISELNNLGLVDSKNVLIQKRFDSKSIQTFVLNDNHDQLMIEEFFFQTPCRRTWTTGIQCWPGKANDVLKKLAEGCQTTS